MIRAEVTRVPFSYSPAHPEVSSGNSISWSPLEQTLPSWPGGTRKTQPGQATEEPLEAGKMEKEQAAFIPLAAVWRNPENLRATRNNLGNFKVQVVLLVLLARLTCSSTEQLNSCPGSAQGQHKALSINNTAPTRSRQSSGVSTHHNGNVEITNPALKSGSSSEMWNPAPHRAGNHPQDTAGC